MIFIVLCLFTMAISGIQVYLDDPHSVERYYHSILLYLSMYTAFILTAIKDKD